MKNALLTFLLAVGVMTYSFGQYPNCTLYITNATSDDLGVSSSTTMGSPNVCPSLFSSVPTYFVASGNTITIPLGVAPPIIRSYQVGCFNFTYPTESEWQVNTCWNPSCVDEDPNTFYDIVFTSCGDYETYITIY